MIGYRLRNNDVHIFFEDNDVKRLGEGKIEGQYVNLRFSGNNIINIGKVCKLETELVPDLDDMVRTTGEKDKNKSFTFYGIQISQRVWNDIISDGWGGNLKGFRNVILIDVDRLGDSQDSRTRSYIDSYRILKSKIKQ